MTNMKYNDDMEKFKKQIEFVFNSVQISFQVEKIKKRKTLREKKIFYLNLNLNKTLQR